MIRHFEHTSPIIGSETYVDPTAVIIGDVVIGRQCSVWPLTVIRGDVNLIRIGDFTNIQDGSVLHVSHQGPYNAEGGPLHIGDHVTVGHKVMLHACTIGDRCLIGMGSIVMDDVVIEDDVILGAGSLVPPGKQLDGKHLWVGNPVQKKRPLTDKEIDYLKYSAEHYVRVKNRYGPPPENS